MAALAPILGALAGSGGTAAGTAGAAAGAAGAGAGLGSALGSAASAIGSGASSLGSAIGSGASALGSALGSGASELGSAIGGLFGHGGGEAGYLASLGQTVPQGVEMVGPSTPLVTGTNAAEAGMLFPQTLSQGMSAVPQAFQMAAPQSSGGWTQMLGQLLSGQGGGGGGSGGGGAPEGPGKQFNIADALGPQMLQTLMNPSAGLTKGAPPAPQLSLPAPNVPQTRPDDRLSFLRAFNSTF